jgi:hypothetical protein
MPALVIFSRSAAISAPFSSTSQLLLDGAELLAQEILALGLVHFLLGLVLNPGLDGQQLEFLVQILVDLFQPGLGLHDLEQLLGLFHVHPDVGRDQVAEPSGVGNALQHHDQVRAHHLAQLDDFFEVLLDRPHQGLHFQGELAGRRLGQHLDPRKIRGRGLGELLDPGPGQALDQDLDPAVREFEHAHNHGGGAHRIDAFGLGVFFGHLLLGAEQDHAVLAQRVIHRGHRALPAHEQGQDHERKDHHVPHRKQRQDLGNLHLLAFRVRAPLAAQRRRGPGRRRRLCFVRSPFASRGRRRPGRRLGFFFISHYCTPCLRPGSRLNRDIVPLPPLLGDLLKFNGQDSVHEPGLGLLRVAGGRQLELALDPSEFSFHAQVIDPAAGFFFPAGVALVHFNEQGVLHGIELDGLPLHSGQLHFHAHRPAGLIDVNGRDQKLEAIEQRAVHLKEALPHVFHALLKEHEVFGPMG